MRYSVGMAYHSTASNIVRTVFLGLCAASVSAQDTSQLNDPAPVGQSEQQPMTFGQMYASVQGAEPTRRAGIRSSLLSQSMQVVPVVFIVDSPSAYLDAISAWEGPLRFPILYDDGTALSRENIA